MTRNQKDSLAVFQRTTQLLTPHRMSMTRRLLLTLLTTTAVLAAGCSHFKKSAPKPTTGIAGEVEADFKVRWVDKRTAELVAHGQAAEAARTQATTEFNERYGYTSAAQK